MTELATQRAQTSGWEHFSHGAGVGVRGRGPTLEASFEQAALALGASVCEPRHVRPFAVVHFELDANDDEALLAAWLSALLEAMRSRGLVFGRFLVRIEGDHLVGRAWGEPFDRVRHAPTRPRARVGPRLTKVRREAHDGAWCAQAVLGA